VIPSSWNDRVGGLLLLRRASDSIVKLLPISVRTRRVEERLCPWGLKGTLSPAGVEGVST
jgi:hypothetical protein